MVKTQIWVSAKFLMALAIIGILATETRADTITVGMSAPKTGPLAGGSTVTHWPNVKLWAHEVNARGGLKLKI